jgi:hypothetical protein
MFLALIGKIQLKFFKTYIYIKTFMNILPFKNVQRIRNKYVSDITHLINFRYLISRVLSSSKDIYLYKIHNNENKIYILETSMDKIINNEINQEDVILNNPRSLINSYEIYVNDKVLTLNEKILLKRYINSTSLYNIYLFQNIELYEIKIIKNGTEFKKYTNDFKNLLIKDVYAFL